MWIAASLLALSVALAQPASGGIDLLSPQARAVVVVPDDAEAVTLYAAQELIAHVALATGVSLAQYAESEVPEAEAVRIYLGPTRAAAAAGIDVGTLPEEAFALRTRDGALYIAAGDGPGDPLSESTTASGVLWGVYEVLERDLGVRWLWPGELGTCVPPRTTWTCGPCDEVVPPRFVQRHLRPSIGPSGFAEADERLCFTEEERAQYAKDQAAFLRRHRMGRSANSYFDKRHFGSGHSFGGWWERFGAEHPEWFQLLPDGRRGPEDLDDPDDVSMCVSNPELHRQIVALWAEERAAHPEVPLTLGVGENDRSAGCECEACRAWDDPLPDLSTLPVGLERSFEPVQAGARYARFALSVQRLAAEIDPEVQVHFYAYLNYFWAPEDLALNPNIVIGFVPWFRWAGWFPRTEAEQAWIKSQWLGWQRTGASVYYRPNWFLDGYAMPHVYMHQFGDAFQFYAQHGMIGSDFDSLQGMWAAQGPNLYLLARIHVRPETPIDDLLDEYYSAFGPTKDAVRTYFDHWEQYATNNRERAARAIQTRTEGKFRRYAYYARVAEELYPPDVFEAGFMLLDEAARLAKGDADPAYAARVDYLRAGLQHARRCVETAVVMNDPGATGEARAAALAALRAYRRGVASRGIANMDRAAIIETDSWDELPGFAQSWPEVSSTPAAESFFRDPELTQGFNLSTMHSGMRPNVIGPVLTGVADPEPQWRLAQWGTRFNLADAAMTRDQGVRTLANAGKTVRIYPGGLAGEGIALTVHGGAEYDGHLRQFGEAWPHLLIEQAFDEPIRLEEHKHLRLHFTFRVEDVKPAINKTLDPGLHTAHITAFFTLNNLNPESPGYRDMIWFGVPLFDARHDIPRGHRALDIGKDDATNKFICTIEGRRFWKTPTGDGAWHTFDEDLLPLMREAMAIAQEAGYCTETRLEDVAATTFNLGWEVPGPYDCTVYLKALRLESE